MSKSQFSSGGLIGIIIMLLLLVFQYKQNRQTLSTLKVYTQRLELLETKTHTLAAKKSSPPQTPRTVVFIDGDNINISGSEHNLKVDFDKLKDQLNTLSPNSEIEFRYYTAINPNSDRDNNFVKRQQKRGYTVITKPISRYADNTAKGNIDPEMQRDMLELSEQYDTAVILTADGDFTCFVETLKNKQKWVQVMSFRPVSHKLKAAANCFTDLETLPVFQSKSVPKSSKPRPVVRQPVTA